MGKSLFLLCLLTTFLYAQELLPSGASAVVRDPLETRYPLMLKIAGDSLYRGEMELHWQNLFGIKGIADYGLTVAAVINRRFAVMGDIRYLGWKYFSKWQNQALVFYSLPEIRNVLGLGLRWRRIEVSDVYENNSFQVDFSGSYNPWPKVTFFWTIKNAFGWGQTGPENESVGAGVNLLILKNVFLGLGTEKNYLYPVNSYAALFGNFSPAVGGGLSYLFLEKTLSFYFSFRKNIFELNIGGSLHPFLGETYRSSVGIYF